MEDWGGQLKSGGRGRETKSWTLAVLTSRLLATHGGSVSPAGEIMRLETNKLEEYQSFCFFLWIHLKNWGSHSWGMKLLDYFRVIENLPPLLLTLGRAS